MKKYFYYKVLKQQWSHDMMVAACSEYHNSLSTKTRVRVFSSRWKHPERDKNHSEDLDSSHFTELTKKLLSTRAED